MPFLLQFEADGRSRTASLDSFARLGASPACDVVLVSRSMPAHAVTIVEESPEVCRVVVKSAGVTINGEPRAESSSLLVSVGQTVDINGVPLLLLAAPQEPDLAARYSAAEIVQHALPGADLPDAPAESDPSAAPPKPATGAGVAIQLFAILVCFGLIGGMVAWLVVGDSLLGGGAVADAGPGPVKLTEVMTRIQKQEAWPWKSIRREDALAALQTVNQLEGQGRTDEARAELLRVRSLLLDDVPKDVRGRYLTSMPPASKAPDAVQKTDAPLAKPKPAAAAPGLSESFFTDPSQREFYDLIVRKYSEL